MVKLQFQYSRKALLVQWLVSRARGYRGRLIESQLLGSGFIGDADDSQIMIVFLTLNSKTPRKCFKKKEMDREDYYS